jgi:prolyl-tRNA synthetase
VPESGDYKLAAEGDRCPRCDGKLQSARGIEVGHIFKLGTKYSQAMDCGYADADGQRRAAVMGCYGIGVTRMVAAWIEQNHDERGILWSPRIAPYLVHLIALNLEDPLVKEGAENLYATLQAAGVEVLFDDRPLRAGEKFGDADLLGMPVRVTVSKRTLQQGKLEFKLRRESAVELLTVEEALERIRGL